MSIKFLHPLNSNKIVENINNRIKDARFNYDLWKKIEKALEKFEGKTFSKRIGTEIQKLLPEYNVIYSTDYGMYMLGIWGNGLSYQDKKTFYMGYHTNPIFSMKQLRESNQWAELEDSRANKLKTLKSDKIKEMVETWNHGLGELQAVYSLAEQFEINYMSYGFDLDIRNP